ncbi:MAG: UDP-N-acetylglucosamine pyrophosphorylase [Verrucomicrobia bacterium]|nr:UDP-N-acetylglucosamine pyrophosphorylase [Verrucomicrobiota bacterium]
MTSASSTPTTAAHGAQGVIILDPISTYIDPALPPGTIAPGVEIHPGCRIRGANTRIGPGCVLGREGPLTLENCQLQADVTLASGYCAESTLLTGVTLGADAHVRPGTLLEEQVSSGHAVGFKQTLLMPFVTTGSLVNFCDCLMAGGTNRRNHSEVGSSYVHFNYTPNRDKATASLIGDVPRGVMLDQAPIFLGGQGGLVGPARIAFGTLIAAGTIWRGDIEEGGHLHYGPRREGTKVILPGVYRNAYRAVRNNLLYIGNLHALRHWYEQVRARFMQGDPFAAAAHAGALTRIASMLAERVTRLGELAQKLAASAANLPPAYAAETQFQTDFAKQWPALSQALVQPVSDKPACAAFLPHLGATSASSYIDALRATDPETRSLGTAWLQGIVDDVVARVSIANHTLSPPGRGRSEG